MKKLFLLFFLNVFLIGCSQTEKQKSVSKDYNIDQYIFPEAKDVTAENYVEKLSTQIKHYKQEPIYYIRYSKQNCLIEVSINDVNLFDDYEISNMITPIPIGNILKTGKQKITVRMLPVGDLNNESLGLKNGKPVTEFTDGSKVDISVICIDEKSGKKLDDEKIILHTASPSEATGKSYYDFSFTFDAQVPYEFEGWSNGQDLRKLDQNLVEKKALEFYKLAGEIHTKKDIDSWLKLNYPSDVRIKSSFYRDNQNILETLDEYNNILTTTDFKMTPIKDYKMKFMGDGKLLMLITNNLNSKFRGGGALYLSHSDGYYLPSIPLFLPKGRDLATQGFMMWK